MIRIPFTKLHVSWHLPAMLAVFMLLAQSWWRGLLAFAALFGILWLFGVVIWGVILVGAEGKKRRPGESWRAFSARTKQENARYSAQRADDLTADLELRYVSLDCGHIAFQRFPDPSQSEGDKFWCWGHRKFGPAQEQTIVSIDPFPPRDDDRKILM